MLEKQPLTKTEKINCRAYEKLIIAVGTFVRTRYFNNNTDSRTSIKDAIDFIADKAITDFYNLI